MLPWNMTLEDARTCHSQCQGLCDKRVHCKLQVGSAPDRTKVRQHVYYWYCTASVDEMYVHCCVLIVVTSNSISFVKYALCLTVTE